MDSSQFAAGQFGQDNHCHPPPQGPSIASTQQEFRGLVDHHPQRLLHGIQPEEAFYEQQLLVDSARHDLRCRDAPISRPISGALIPNVYQAGNKSEIRGLGTAGEVTAGIGHLTAQDRPGGLKVSHSIPGIFSHHPSSIGRGPFGQGAGYQDVAAQVTMPAKAYRYTSAGEQTTVWEGLRAVSLSNRADMRWFYGHQRLDSEELRGLAVTGRFSPSLAEHMIRHPNHSRMSARQVEILRQVARGAEKFNPAFGDRSGAGHELRRNQALRTAGGRWLDTIGEGAARSVLGANAPGFNLIPPTPEKLNGQGSIPSNLRSLHSLQMPTGRQRFPPAREAAQGFATGFSDPDPRPLLASLPVGSNVDWMMTENCHKPRTLMASSSVDYQGSRRTGNGASELSNASDSTGHAARSEASSGYQGTTAVQATYLGYGGLNGSIHYAGSSGNSTTSGAPDSEPGDPWGIRAARRPSAPVNRSSRSSPVNGPMGHFSLPTGGDSLFARGNASLRDQSRSASVDGSRRTFHQ